MEAVAIMRGSHVGTLVVVDGQRRLRGLLTERDARFVSGSDVNVADRMTPLDKLVVRHGPVSLDAADGMMVERKIKKLPLVDDDGILTGLVTAKDILKQRRLPFATRDAQGRLRVAAAIGATGDYLERAVELDRAGADVLVIDIAHGHPVVMERALNAVRQRLGDAQVIAGNVATGEGALFLAERGADGVKVGIGPGGGCTTRMTTSFGVPQLQALVDCGEGLGGRVPAIADGGIKRDGSVVTALLLGADTVMLGGAFAGTLETPGEIVHKSVLLPESQKPVKVPVKVLRGMASIGAIKDRLDVEDVDTVDLQALGAEGLEVSVPARGSARPIIQDMAKHLCSSISYGGAVSLAELKERFRAHPNTTSFGCRRPLGASRTIGRRSPGRDIHSHRNQLAGVFPRPHCHDDVLLPVQYVAHRDAALVSRQLEFRDDLPGQLVVRAKHRTSGFAGAREQP